MNRSLWNRLPAETSKAYLTFCHYRDLGSERSLRKLVQTLNKTPTYLRQLAHWSKKHHWPERVEAYDFHLLEKERQAFEDQLVKRRLELKQNELQVSKQLFTQANKILLETTNTPIDGENISSTFLYNLTVKVPRMLEAASKIGRRALDMPLEPHYSQGEKGQLDEIAKALKAA